VQLLSTSQIYYHLSQLAWWNLCKRWSCPCASLIKHYVMKTWGSGGIAPLFLISALDGCDWSAWWTRWRAPGAHWIGGCEVGKKNISCPWQGLNSSNPICSWLLCWLSCGVCYKHAK
jgi:hypothetical protein